MTKTEQYIESLGCPIRKGTELVFIAIKGRGEKYGWDSVTMSKNSHSRFGIGRSQLDLIIKDFRQYGILQGDTPKKKLGEFNKPNRYTIPLTIIKFFKKLNTVFKGIKDMNDKIFDLNQSITKEQIIKLLNKFNLGIQEIDSAEDYIEYGAKALIVVDDKYYNAFDYIKEKTNLSTIELANYYLRLN